MKSLKILFCIIAVTFLFVIAACSGQSPDASRNTGSGNNNGGNISGNTGGNNSQTTQTNYVWLPVSEVNSSGTARYQYVYFNSYSDFKYIWLAGEGSSQIKSESICSENSNKIISTTTSYTKSGENWISSNLRIVEYDKSTMIHLREMFTPTNGNGNDTRYEIEPLEAVNGVNRYKQQSLNDTATYSIYEINNGFIQKQTRYSTYPAHVEWVYQKINNEILDTLSTNMPDWNVRACTFTNYSNPSNTETSSVQINSSNDNQIVVVWTQNNSSTQHSSILTIQKFRYPFRN